MRRALPLFVLCLIGCHGPNPKLSDAPPATLAPGWTSIKNDSHGVSIGVLPGWKQGLGSMMGNMGDSGSGSDPNNPLSDALKSAEDSANKQMNAQLEQEGILLVCSNGSRPIPGEEQTRFYLKLDQASAGADLARAAGTLKHDMMGHDPEPVETAMGKSLFVRSNYTSKGGDKVHERGYVFVDGEKVYQLRFITTGDAQPIDSIYEDVMKTLRIKPGAAK